MPEVNILYLYFKSLYLLIILLFLYCNYSKFRNHHSARPFTTFEAATENRNHKTFFKIFESTSERVTVLKRRLANIQSIFFRGTEKHHSGRALFRTVFIEDVSLAAPVNSLKFHF